VDEYDRFIAATRNYRMTYRRWNTDNPDFRDPKTNAVRQIDESIIQSIPQLPYTPESPGELFLRTLVDFALMAAMTIVFLVGAFFAFFRYDVR
jgi:hypothetical protein